ncbi:MAG TPA: type I-C CRISPR-associated protein Cas8c/Csd1 [Lachnospiraceae bacterium]|nr:type I-C CRISPR-associated protein Cas8c/Csd1 [Lachnospiraceae bacterium]
MSWINALSDTYDNCIGKVGEFDNQKNVLLPISHLTAQAQIEIFVDYHGNFIRAERVGKEDATTIIPVTEESASRSSGIAAMPLCDKLCYVAEDFDKYCQPKKSMEDYHKEYMKGLAAWAERPNTPKKVKAIYEYLKKGTVVSDLLKSKTYEKPEDFVRFSVESKELKAEDPRVWTDKEVFKNFSDFYNTTLADRSYCYSTGDWIPVTGKLPAKLRNTGDKAKLISSNDKQGFTFRGRFTEASEAAEIGYETAQKAFNALRWLIAKQGYRNGSESIVCWAVGNERIPPICAEPDSLFPFESDDAKHAETEELYAKRVNKAIAGYKTDITPKTKIIVMAVDTADGSGQGRLALTYYCEMLGSDFLNYLQSWHLECEWEHNYHKNEKGEYYRFIGAPSPREIALAAYGTDREGLLKADDKVIKKCVDRILPCISQGKRIPKDIVLSAVKNASEPERFSGYNWNRILTNTCAIIKKYQIDYGKEVYSMALNENSNDRNYLFGRLLAVCDRIEGQYYYREKIQRETNAKKYWSMFSRKPARTLSVIRDRINPYLEKLNDKNHIYEKERYTKLMEELFDRLGDVQGFTNEPLNENYLLGYYSQMADFRKAAEKAVAEKAAEEKAVAKETEKKAGEENGEMDREAGKPVEE